MHGEVAGAKKHQIKQERTLKQSLTLWIRRSVVRTYPAVPFYRTLPQDLKASRREFAEEAATAARCCARARNMLRRRRRLSKSSNGVG